MRDFEDKSGKDDSNSDPTAHFEITLVQEVTK